MRIEIKFSFVIKCPYKKARESHKEERESDIETEWKQINWKKLESRSKWCIMGQVEGRRIFAILLSEFYYQNITHTLIVWERVGGAKNKNRHIFSNWIRQKRDQYRLKWEKKVIKAGGSKNRKEIKANPESKSVSGVRKPAGDIHTEHKKEEEVKAHPNSELYYIHIHSFQQDLFFLIIPEVLLKKRVFSAAQKLL